MLNTWVIKLDLNNWPTDSRHLKRFPKVRTGPPDHGRTRHFGNEIGFFKEVLLNIHQAPFVHNI